MKKRILLMAAMLLAFQAAFAQGNVENAKKAAEKARTATLDPKSSAKSATWINFGKKLMDAYNAPTKEFASVQYKVQLSDLGIKPKQTEVVELEGKPVEKLSFENANLYFSNQGGQLLFTEVKNAAYDDALEQAFAAYKKAFELDPKKSKDVATAFMDISGKFLGEATFYYYTQKLDKAAYMFEQAALVSAEPPCGQLDTMSLFNASVAARMAGDNAKAKEILDKCLAYGYDSEGKVYSALFYVTAAGLENAKDAADSLAIQKEAKAYLEQGIDKYPLNQEIVINLINQKIQLQEDPQEIFDLFTKAKEQDPKNASLYAVEADIRSKLGMKEEAIAGYRKSVEVDPKYEYGYYCIGKFYYDEAMALYDQAQREDDNAKYEVLVGEYMKALEQCVEPFESFFNISTEKNNKDVAAQYLKIVCYNLYSAYSRQDKEELSNQYKEKNQKYNAYLKGE
jgi:Tfp pilus assembly protein PilF